MLDNKEQRVNQYRSAVEKLLEKSMLHDTTIMDKAERCMQQRMADKTKTMKHLILLPLATSWGFKKMWWQYNEIWLSLNIAIVIEFSIFLRSHLKRMCNDCSVRKEKEETCSGFKRFFSIWQQLFLTECDTVKKNKITWNRHFNLIHTQKYLHELSGIQEMEFNSFVRTVFLIVVFIFLRLWPGCLPWTLIQFDSENKLSASYDVCC